MGRGCYDVTGLRWLPRPSARSALSLGHRAHATPTDHSIPIIEPSLPADSVPEPMEIEPSASGNTQHREAEHSQPSATTATGANAMQSSDQTSSAQASQDHPIVESEGNRPPRFTEEQKLLLELWMADNQESPYPNSAAKQHLAVVTGLTPKQVQQFCSNYRRRNLGKSFTSCAASASSVKNAHESSSRAGDIGMEHAFNDEQPKGNSPTNTEEDALEASTEARPPSLPPGRSPQSPYLAQYDSPDVQDGEECTDDITISCISESNENLLHWWLRVHFDIISDASEKHGNSSNTCAPSGVAKPVTLRSVAQESSITSCYSAQDLQSNAGSMQSTRGSRRGRRAYGNLSQNKRISNMLAVHVCEQCGNDFQRASTLKRHVQSVHENKQRWVCAPVVMAEGSLLCPTCLQDPMDCEHGMLTCWERSEEDRTFYRKDSLKQHLKLVHGFGSELTTAGETALAMLGAHTWNEDDPNTALRRVAVQVIQKKLACYFWSSQSHNIKRDVFDIRWAESLSRALSIERDSSPPPALVGQEITNHLTNQLTEVFSGAEKKDVIRRACC
ncbi:hypothetical protein HJFPF1_04495 [Paramyrothecium foliicola]|nr:hypothetical protein HJFPF1_04495 [Paramyrothecium foliicola]